MLGTSKSASLTSGLLARKGQARPAMRPGYVGLTPAPSEDLGWNDMGEDQTLHPVAQFAPAPTPQPVPPVLREREVLETKVAAAPVVRSAKPALAPLAAERIAREVGTKSKAAFTLRLDTDRHLRLRLASAVSHRSAQQLVTEALDVLLGGMPEVEALAIQLPQAKEEVMRSRKFLGIGASALVLVTALSGVSAVQSAVDANKAEAANAKRAAGLADKAQRALARRDAAKAVHYAENAVALDPRNAEYRGLLGQGYLLSGRFTSASQALADALTLDPGNGRAALNLALARVGTGDWNGAVATLNDHAPQIPAADLGLALALAGQATKGVEVLGSAVRQPEANAKTRQNLALALALSGHWKEAKDVAGVDLPIDQVDARIVQWAKFAKPENAYDQVAALLGVQAVADHGQPVQLALRDSSTVMAAVTQTVQSSVQTTAASIDTFMPGASARPVTQPAPEALVPVVAAAVEPLTEATEAAPALASVGAGIVFGPRHEIVQSVPTSRKTRSAASAVTAVRQPVSVFAVPGKGSYYVQLGAFANAGVARDAWRRAARRIPVLSQQTPLSGNVTTRAGAFHRLSVGGFNRSSAVALCVTVKASGGTCFVRSGAGEKVASWSKGVQLASR